MQSNRQRPCGARRADTLALMADSLPFLQSQAQTSSLAVGYQLWEGILEHFTSKSNRWLQQHLQDDAGYMVTQPEL